MKLGDLLTVISNMTLRFYNEDNKYIGELPCTSSILESISDREVVGIEDSTSSRILNVHLR